jgi:NSS family neurotransmitter:Na+ symporter
LGQAFFSLSLGMAIMITYGSYLRKDEDLAKNTLLVCGLDTLISVMAGFMMIGAVFASGVSVGMGGGFAFISLAGVFQQMPGGAFFGVLFYSLLLFAAITSAMSLMEAVVAPLIDHFKMSRMKATIGSASLMFVLGIVYTITQGAYDWTLPWLSFSGVSFPSIAYWLEYLTDHLFIPINALTACILAGWVWGAKNAVDEVEQNGKFSFKLAGAWMFMVKFVAPAAIIIIFLGGFGFFDLFSR